MKTRILNWLEMFAKWRAKIVVKHFIGRLKAIDTNELDTWSKYEFMFTALLGVLDFHLVTRHLWNNSEVLYPSAGWLGYLHIVLTVVIVKRMLAHVDWLGDLGTFFPKTPVFALIGSFLVGSAIGLTIVLLIGPSYPELDVLAYVGAASWSAWYLYFPTGCIVHLFIAYIEHQKFLTYVLVYRQGEADAKAKMLKQ